MGQNDLHPEQRRDVRWNIEIDPWDKMISIPGNVGLNS
jgi:hypothetical protein